DRSSRLTAVSAGTLRIADQPWTAVAIWQQQGRSHAGAEARLPEPLTEKTSSRAFVGQLHTHWQPYAGVRAAVAAGVGWRDDDDRLRGQGPMVSDLEGEWLWMARPTAGERLRRTRIDGRAWLQVGDHIDI